MAVQSKYTRIQMEKILVGKLIATSARQIGMFLVILSVVSAAIVAFIIDTLTFKRIYQIRDGKTQEKAGEGRTVRNNRNGLVTA